MANFTHFSQDFPAQKPGEKIILILRKHWAVLAWPFLKAAACLVLAIVLPTIGQIGFYIFNYAFVTFIYLAWLVFWVSFLAYEYLNWYRDRFVITNKRVVNIDQKSLFSRRVSEVELDHIQDISHEIIGVVATTFDFGNVVLASAGSDKIELKDIPQPAAVQDLIFKLVKEATNDAPVLAEELVDFIKKQRQ